MKTRRSKSILINTIGKLHLACLLGMQASAPSAPAAVTTIPFDGAPLGLLAPSYYPGLTFATDPVGMSPQVQASGGNQFLQLSEPLYITFTSPQQRVAFYAGLPAGWATAPVTFTAYSTTDPGSPPIASVTLLVTNASLTTPLELQRMLSADIMMVQIAATALTIDNLQFESGNPLGTRTLIDFDHLPALAGLPLSTQIPGVSFDTAATNAVAIEPYLYTITPPSVLKTTAGEVGNPGFIGFTLDPPQAAVRVRVGNPTTGSLTASLRAYSSYHLFSETFYTEVGSAQLTLGAFSAITNILEVDLWPTAYIDRVEIEYSGDQWEYIDNVEFAPNSPNPTPDTTPPVIAAFTVNGQAGPVSVWRPDGSSSSPTNITVAGVATDNASLAAVVVYVLNVTTSLTTSNTLPLTGTNDSFSTSVVTLTPGTNLVWAVAVDNAGNVSFSGPVVTVVEDFPATAVYAVSPAFGRLGLHLRDTYVYYPPDDYPMDIPPTGQTITVSGTNLHSRVSAYFNIVSSLGWTIVPPSTVAPDGSWATYAVPNVVFSGAYAAGSPIQLNIGDDWPGDDHFVWFGSYTIEAPAPLPMPMVYGFNFFNRPDGVDGNDFDDAIDGDSHMPNPLCFANPLNLIFYPAYALALEVVSSPGSCFGMAATSQMFNNGQQGFWDRNFSGLPYPTGVYYPIGWRGGPGWGSWWVPGDCGPADPSSLWAEIRANHGIQFSGQFIEHFLGQCFPDDPTSRLAEVAANPHNFIVSMVNGFIGHAVAPYAVVGNRIYVTDSNLPYDWQYPDGPDSQAATNAFIEVDTVANTFTYLPGGFTNNTGLFTTPMSIFLRSRGYPLDVLAYIDEAVCGSADPLYSTPDGTKSLGWTSDGTSVTNLPGAAVMPVVGNTNQHGTLFVAVPTNYPALKVQANVRTNGPYLFMASNAGRVLECHALDGAAGQTATLSLSTSNGQPYSVSYKAPTDGIRMVPRLGLRNGSFDAVFEIGGLTLPAGGGVQVSFTPATNSILVQNLSPVTLHPLLVYTSTDDLTNGTSLAFGPFDLPTAASYRLTVAYSPVKPLLTVEILDPASNVYQLVAMLSGFDTRTRFNPGPDCNQNGILDSIDIALGTSLDLNGDGIPDECQTAPPHLLNQGLNPNGQFTFRVLGLPGLTYVIETSPDLQKWTPVLTNQASASGSLTYAGAAQANSAPAAFYRARVAP